MLNVSIQALRAVFAPGPLIVMIAGVLIGLVFGAIPGLNGPIALALFIPLTYRMDSTLAFAFLLGTLTATIFGGSITAILINIPGTSQSLATAFDGYPLTQKGEARRALGASATASAFGGLIGVAVLVLTLPVMKRLIMTFGPPEFFMLCVFGLTAIAGISGGSVIKGLLSGILGLLISFIGFDPMTGTQRFTMGSMFLWEGIDLTAALVGLFAVSEAIALYVDGGSIAKGGRLSGSALQGAVDVLRNWFLVIRCSAIGTLVGMMPGVGGTVANVAAYAHAVQTSRYPEKFGTGVIEGVIAPESANNAKEGGSLIPTIGLGIPGSTSMALLIGALMIHGVNPGPDMLRQHIDLVWILIWTVAASTILASAIGMALVGPLSKVSLVRAGVLAPLIMVTSLTGVYAVQGRVGDILVAIIFGVLGYWMRKSGYNPAATIIGVVLGSIVETNFYLSTQMFGYSFFGRPITVVLLLISLASLLVPVVSYVRMRRRAA